MEKKKMYSLRIKTASVIAGALAAIVGNKTEAAVTMHSGNTKDANKHELKEKRSLTKRLVLKLNFFDPRNSFSLMHTSHSSHSSHSSHASSSISSGHASHVSHVSSSVSPSYSEPSYTPMSIPETPSVKTNRSTTKTQSTPDTYTGTTTVEEHVLGTRTLKLGMEGTDVEEMQELLISKGYEVKPSGFFGDETDKKVKAFQKDNHVTPDGKVGPSTLKMLKY